MNRPRVLLADDHRMLSDGLKSLLADDFDLVGIVEDGLALVATARELRPDVIVADISMPHLSGIDAAIELRKDNPEIKIVFLTMHLDPAYARRALEAGARGFVVKHAAAAELVLAINAALKDQTYVTPAVAGGVLNHPPQPAVKSTQSLTAREILRLLAEGRSAKEIAASLALSAQAVEMHKHELMDTHGLQDSDELIQFATRHGGASD